MDSALFQSLAGNDALGIEQKRRCEHSVLSINLHTNSGQECCIIVCMLVYLQLQIRLKQGLSAPVA